jgi:hypothetical protein
MDLAPLCRINGCGSTGQWGGRLRLRGHEAEEKGKAKQSEVLLSLHTTGFAARHEMLSTMVGRMRVGFRCRRLDSGKTRRGLASVVWRTMTKRTETQPALSLETIAARCPWLCYWLEVAMAAFGVCAAT